MTEASALYAQALQLARDKNPEAVNELNNRVNQGDPEAKFQVAVIMARPGLLDGILRGKKKLDDEQLSAVRLFNELEAVGFDGTAFLLGYLHRASDPELAKYWLRIAAERGDHWSSTATLVLGILLFEEGSDEAVGLIERAAAAGENGLAHFYLAKTIEDRDKDLALALYRTAYEGGLDGAYYPAAAILLSKGDKDEALRLFETGAGLGDVAAMVALSNLLRSTRPLTALKWFWRYVRAGGPKRVYGRVYKEELRKARRPAP